MAKKKSTSTTTAANNTKVGVTQHPITTTGNVTLSLKKGNVTTKKITLHNSATILMFQGLARFLQGYFNLSNTSSAGYIPNYLGIGYVPSSSTSALATDPLSTSLYNEYDIGTRFKIDPQNISIDSSAKTVTLPLQATIPYSSVGSSRISELGLFPTETCRDSTMLARVIIPTVDSSGDCGIEIPVGMTLAVEWNIIIQNIS